MEPRPYRKYLVFGAVGLSLLAGACTRQTGERSETIAEIQKREGVPVKTVTVERGKLQVIETAGGTIQGYNQTELKTAIPARITAVNVRVGSYVKKDAVLIQLDRTSMASRYREAKVGLDMAQSSYDRVKALAEEGAVSQEVMDQARTGLTMAQTNYDKVNKMVNILAPFNGTIVELNAKVNDQANPEGGQGGPPPLAVIARLDRIMIEMRVNEVSINKYRKGQRAFIVHNADTLFGKINNVAIAGGAQTHAFTVKAEFKNPGLKLKPGMYMTVNTIVYTAKKALKLPVTTVHTEGATPYVYAIKGNKAVKRTIKLGARSLTEYEIISGLEAGEKVVLQGASQLAEGTKVKVVE